MRVFKLYYKKLSLSNPFLGNVLFLHPLFLGGRNKWINARIDVTQRATLAWFEAREVLENITLRFL